MQLSALPRHFFGINRGVIKTFRCMQLIGAFLLGFCLQVAATGVSQTVTLSMKNARLETVLDAVKEQTGYFISYKTNQLKSARPVTVHAENMPLQDFLQQMLKGQQLEFAIEVKTIFIRKKKPFSSPVQHDEEKSAVIPPPVELKGAVTNKNGEPLEGVSVSIKGTNRGTITGSDGKFQLMVPDNELPVTLEFSYIGYERQAIKSDGQTVFKIALVESIEGFADVVVVGYGTKKRADVTGAISMVKGEDIKQNPAANLSNSIAGRIPGVIINNRSGEPGQDASQILIRGKGTLNDNSPLIVIDGIANAGSFDRLNPDDIESVTVLKDASAAIYGAQAANGVILVTTKRGKAGQPLITYDGNYSLTQPTRIPKLINAWEYATYKNEINARTGLPAEFTEEQIQHYKDGDDPLNYPNTNWLNAILKDLSPQTRHSLSLRGGGEKVSYFVSGGYLYQDGIFRNSATDYNQYNFRSNVDANLNKNFKLSFDVAGRMEDRRYSNVTGAEIFSYTYGTFPTLPDFYPNGLPGAGVEAGRNPVLLASGASGFKKVKDYFLQSRVVFELKLPYITEGLSLSGFAGYNFQFNNVKLLNDNWDSYRYDKNTGQYINYRNNLGPINLNESFRNYNLSTYNIKLGYDRSFNQHKVSAFVAYEQSEGFDEGIGAYRTGYLTNQIDQISVGGNTGLNNSGTAFQSARQNVFGRISYNFDERYLAELILRYDGSFNFPVGRQWGTFPGVSLGWRISEESFFKNNVSFINQLKLKASWARLGNDKIAPYQSLLQYNRDAGYYFGANLDRVPGLSLGVVPNPFVTWEVSDTKNIGIESSLWGGALNVNADYFFANRNNILVSRNASIPTSTGLSSANLPAENIGKVSSHGFELEVFHRGKFGADFTYSIGANFTHTQNTIDFIDEAAGVPDWQKAQGHPMDSWLLYKTDGIYHSQAEIDGSAHLTGARPGDIKYIDLNKDGKITSNDQIRIYESAIPLNTFGIPMGIKYKGIGLSLLWQGQSKAKQVIRPTFNPLTPPRWMYDDRWTATNTNGKMPASFAPNDNFNTLESDFWLRNASFIRLKTVELSYNLSAPTLSQFNMQDLEIYLSAFNLFTISKIKDYDPELSASNGGYYPQTRIYNAGVRISF